MKNPYDEVLEFFKIGLSLDSRDDDGSIQWSLPCCISDPIRLNIVEALEIVSFLTKPDIILCVPRARGGK